MLQNAYLLAKIGANTAENERNFAEILPNVEKVPEDPAHAAVSAGRELLASRGGASLAGSKG